MRVYTNAVRAELLRAEAVLGGGGGMERGFETWFAGAMRMADALVEGVVGPLLGRVADAVGRRDVMMSGKRVERVAVTWQRVEAGLRRDGEEIRDWLTELVNQVGVKARRAPHMAARVRRGREMWTEDWLRKVETQVGARLPPHVIHQELAGWLRTSLGAPALRRCAHWVADKKQRAALLKQLRRAAPPAWTRRWRR